MKIEKICVEHFRSLDKVEIILSNLNTFVGPNNHGKTNFLEAINWFYSGKTKLEDKQNYKTDLEIKVEITYSDAQKSLNLMEDGKSKTTFKNMLDGEDTFVVKKTSSDDKRVVFVKGEGKGNPAGFDSALNQFLPKLEYVTTKIKLADVSKFKSKTPIAEMLSGVLVGVLENDPKYQEFLKLFDIVFNDKNSTFREALNKIQGKVEFYLQKQFPDGTKVHFQIEDPEVEDLLKKFETEIDDGIKTKAEDKGDGMQRAIMLAIVQAYADFRRESKIARNFLFLIDEAELHLHPSAQRALKQALVDILEVGDQVLISTHSSVFVVEPVENQKIFEVLKNKNNTEINELNDANQHLNIIYNLLGGSPSDLLLPRNFIIVEGQSDEKFLETIVKRFYPNDFHGIKILFARGDIDMEKEIFQCIHRAYTPLHTNGVYKNTTIIICDKPNDTSKLNKFKSAHPWIIEGEQLHVLSVSSLEEYYPPPYTKSVLEAKKMSTDGTKISYAIEVAGKITKNEFDTKMSILKNVLDKCIEKAYK